MVVILNFNSNTEKYYCSLLDSMNIEYKISLKEIDISKADHVILPDTNNLSRIIKKMQLMNLYSLLRIIKIPILGINNGMILMCNKIVDINKSGLGFFNIKASLINIESPKDIEYNFGKIEKLAETELLLDVPTQKIAIRNLNYLEKNSFSVSKINMVEKEISFIMRKNNHYGVQIDIEKNKYLFGLIIKNFLSKS